MARYRLDDLGWFHFEKLTQSLMKAELGLSVQSWGGHGDLGRDAYSLEELAFPNRSIRSAGPFLFQAKFVQGANAAGAHWQRPLMQALSAEQKNIAKRSTLGTWKPPAHYVLLTNCPVTPNARQVLEDALKPVLPSSTLTTLGADDISDLLDNHPELRKSFPEIMSLRDLDELLMESVSKPILERSRAAVEECRQLVPVFVPTSAYHKAWQCLQKHAFVVLDGPPEMGKTAIARTLAFAHLLTDWQVIDCRNPEDVFSVFSLKSQQIFIADDAFGRTEYDPVLGRMWERDLPHVFRRLDSTHRLVWTTRKHILLRALREMDLTGDSARFPAPAEVIVTADDLSVEEKARILYRHARAAELNEVQRTIVREHAVETVANRHFTPERIRRFVHDVLPQFAATSDVQLELAAEIDEAIRNPTDRMRKSFRKLPGGHAWVLIALLECDGPAQSEMLRSRFSAFRPDVSESAFYEALDDLMGTFLKDVPTRFRPSENSIDWIHPSYRDLVIDELTSNLDNQMAFLRGISKSGIKLAISEAGGATGQRQLPLVTSENGWQTLERRVTEIAASESVGTVIELLDILGNARKAEGLAETTRRKIDGILQATCQAAVQRWDRVDQPISAHAYRTYLRVTQSLHPRPELPNVEASWEAASEEIEGAVRAGELFDADRLANWCELADIIEVNFAAIAESDAFCRRRSRLEAELFSLAEELLSRGLELAEDLDANDSEGTRLERFAEALQSLDRGGEYESQLAELTSLAERYREHGNTTEEQDYEPDSGASRDDFDIVEFFSDL